MAGENRSFFKRSFEIVSNVGISIGKDYTTNLQDLVSDASDIKNNVIRGATDAKSQFQEMRRGTGPIKGLLDWFFTKENEYDPFSLDDEDDFDAGTLFGDDDEDEDTDSTALNVKDTKEIVKGQIGSMYKIASKFAETQVANTAEIITTVNNRTSEIIASANNINTTLTGISQKLDAITRFMNTRTFANNSEQDKYNTLTDVNGRYTLGKTWDAAKQGLENGTFGTLKSGISTLSQFGALTPEFLARMAFDMTLGNKQLKFLGDQSINEFGKRFNDAIGQTISDALSNAMDTNIFKKIFGDVKSESRSSNFRNYITSEYNRDPAVFDGMTRTSIVKTIPEYLKKIYESLSGTTLNVGKHGELTSREGNTFKSLATESMTYNGFSSDVLSGYMDSKYASPDLKSQYDVNTISKLLTTVYISFMISNELRVIDKRYVNPDDTQLVARVAYYFAMNQKWYNKDGSINIERAYPIVQSLLSYINSNRSILNTVVGDINNAYEEFFRKMKSGVSGVIDLENVNYIGYTMTNSILEETANRRQRPVYTPPKQVAEPNSDIAKFLGETGSGDPLKIYAGNETGETRTFTNTLNDIRNLLAATTKSLIGSDAYSKVEAKLSQPTVANTIKSPTFYDIDKSDIEAKQRVDYSDISTKGSLKQFMSAFGSDADANFRLAMSPDGTANGLTDLYEHGKMIGGRAYNTLHDKAVDIKNSEFVQNAWGYGKNRVEQLRDFSKEQLDRLGDKIEDTRYNLTVKSSLGKLGNSKEDEEDRNTVSMISAFMQTAIQSGSASLEEKGSIQRLIDSIHDMQLRQKMSKSVTAMLDRASFKADVNTDSGKKTIFGKILSAIGLIVSPVKLMSKAVTFILPKLFTGLKKYTKLFNFGKDIDTIKQSFSDMKSGFGDLFAAQRDYRADKRQQKINKRAQTLGDSYMQTGKDGSFSYNYNYVETPRGFGTGFEEDYSKFYGSNAKTAINNAEHIRVPDSLLKELIRRDEESEKEARNELKEARKALKDAEKEQTKKEKSSDDKEGGLIAGFMQGFSETFKGLGSFSDFKKSFKEAIGLSPKKVTVDGVDGEAESFTDKILAKFMNIFTGKEDSVFKKIEENTDEKESGGVVDDIKSKISGDSNDGNNNDGNNVSSNASELISTISSKSSGQTASAISDFVKGGTGSKTLTTAAEGAMGAIGSTGASAASAATGVVGKSLSIIGKIGASVGKIVGSLGTIGMAVAKIVIKATLMLSGFKALMSTINSITAELTKVVKIGLEPLNKIFHAVNKIIKPLIKTLSTFMKKVMSAISSIVSSIVDTIVPILNSVITPVLKLIEPALDLIVKTISPIAEMLSSVIETQMIPVGGIIRYTITPLIKRISATLNIIVGTIEVSAGILMKGLGNILAGIGIIGKMFGASKLYESGRSMANSGDQMMNQGFADMKNGITDLISTTIKAFALVDQSDDTENTHIKNPNAAPITSIGSVMDGTTASGDYNKIYGSGNKPQRAYGNTLDIANNGCGPLALADAASRRSGSRVDGLTMAKSMANSGAYEPGRGTSVGSFVSAANSMGMGLRAGGVTQASLKLASPTNPITVVGSGSDFGTRKGNNHYMNVVGTDGIGGAYVSNPLTGRVDRMSSSSLVGSALLGLYGHGDTDYYTLPEAITEAMGELKNLTSSILGLFTKSTSDEMNEAMNEYNADSQLEAIRNSINNAQNDEYGGKTYEEIEEAARASAMTDFESKHPRQAGETEDAYEARFNKWYTKSRQLEYMSKEGAYDVAKEAMDHRTTSISSAFNKITSGFSEAASNLQESYDTAQQYGSSSSGSRAGGGTLSADTGAVLFTNKYTPTITSTNITNGGNTAKMESPLHEFFSMMSGNQADSSNSSNTGGWFKGYNKPVSSEGVSSSGGHEGIDFNWSSGSDGKPLYATTGGTVISSGWSDSAGNNIKWKDDGGYYHWYMHLRDLPTKKNNDQISGGDLLGFVGNTGNSFGSHLHYSIHSQNPAWSSDYTVNPLTYFKNYKPPTASGMKGSTEEEKIFSYLVSQGMSPIGAAGLLGCFKYESNLQSNNLENTYNDLFGLSDADYTSRVNSGKESEADFVNGRNHPEKVGYGIAQFTSSNLKQDLYNNTVKVGKGIDYLPAQLDRIISVLKERNIYDVINNATTPTDANKTFLHKYEAGTAYTSDSQVVAAYPWMGWEGVNNRHQYAEDVYARLKDWVYDSSEPEVNYSVSTANINSAGDERMFKNQKHVGYNSGKAYGIIDTGSTGKEGVDVFSSPRDGVQPMNRIPKNTKVYAEYDGNNGWVKVTYNGMTGYIKSQYFRGTEDATQTSNKSNSSITANLVKQMKAANVSDTLTKLGHSIASPNLSIGQNSSKNFGFDIWQPSQYRKLGTSGDAVSKRTDAFKYLADLSANAFDQSNAKYNRSFRDTWYIPGAKDNEQLSYWGGWSGDYNNWNKNPSKYSDEFPEELKALRHVYGMGDNDTPTTNIIPALSNDFMDKVNQFNDVSELPSNITVNHVNVTPNNDEANRRLNAILNNTFKVREERVEYLLEKILEKLDDKDNPSGIGDSNSTSSVNMFDDEYIPTAIARLSRG